MRYIYEKLVYTVTNTDLSTSVSSIMTWTATYTGIPYTYECDCSVNCGTLSVLSATATFESISMF